MDRLPQILYTREFVTQNSVLGRARGFQIDYTSSLTNVIFGDARSHVKFECLKSTYRFLNNITCTRFMHTVTDVNGDGNLEQSANAHTASL